MNKFIIAAAFTAILSSPAFAASTISPSTPAQGAPLNSAPIRGQFGAAITDINNIEGKFAGPAAPSMPTQYQDWIDTSTNPPTWRIFDGGQWVAIGTLNYATHTWTPSGGSGGGYVTGSGLTAGVLVVGQGGSAITEGPGYGTSGPNTVVETTATGQVSPSVLPLATTSNAGVVKPDGTSITVSGTGVLSASGSSSSLPWYNVKGYGAKGDGTTDDTVAINAAKAAADATGGILYFPVGHYMVSSKLLETGWYVTWAGDGPGSSYIDALPSFTAGDVVEFSHAAYGGMQNIGVTSFPVRTAGADVGAIIRDNHNFALTFSNISAAGGLYTFYIDGGSIGTIVNNSWLTNNRWSVPQTPTACLMITGVNATQSDGSSGNPQETFFTNVEVGGCTTNTLIQDASGLYFTNVSNESSGLAVDGVVINPSSSQMIYAVDFTNTLSEVASPTTGNPWLIEGTGQINDINMFGGESAYGAVAITVNNPNLHKLNITGGYYGLAAQQGAVLAAGDRIVLNGVDIDGNSTSGAGAYPGVLISGATNSIVQGSTISGVNQSYPVQITGGSNNSVVNNNFSNNANTSVPDAGTSDYICGNQPGATCNNVTVTSSLVVPDNAFVTTTAGHNVIKGNSAGVAVGDGTQIVFLGPTVPDNDNSFTLGTSTNRWNDVQATNAHIGNLTVTGTCTGCGGSGSSGVSSFNTRTGAITLSSTDVTGALGYTPLSSAVTSVSAGYATTVRGTSGAPTVSANAQVPLMYETGSPTHPIEVAGYYSCGTTGTSMTISQLSTIVGVSVTANSTTPVAASAYGISGNSLSIITAAAPSTGWCWVTVAGY